MVVSGERKRGLLVPIPCRLANAVNPAGNEVSSGETLPSAVLGATSRHLAWPRGHHGGGVPRLAPRSGCLYSVPHDSCVGSWRKGQTALKSLLASRNVSGWTQAFSRGLL